MINNRTVHELPSRLANNRSVGADLSRSMIATSEEIGIVGDSILYTGIVPGAGVSMGSSIPGVTAYFCSLACSVATTGTLEYRASDRSVRFTAPGDSPGSWVNLTQTKRQWIPSATATMQVEIVCLFGSLGQRDASSTLSLSPNPAYTLLGQRSVPSWFEIFSGQRCRTINACAPGSAVGDLPDLISDLFERAQSAGVTLTEVWIQSGTNNFSSGATPDVTLMLGEITNACEIVRAGGCLPRVFSVPMRSFSGGSAAQIGWRNYNRMLPSTVKAAGGVFDDIWSCMVDPASSTAAKSGTVTDQIHPSDFSAFCAGVDLYNRRGGYRGGVSPFIVTPVDAYNASTNPSGNLLPGTPAGTSGTNGQAWAGSTAYALGASRTNDGGKVYRCTSAGTSASSGGPTGTGTSISDGTCVWDYVGTPSVATLFDARANSGSITILATKEDATDGGPEWQKLSFQNAAAITDEAKYEYNLGVGSTDVASGDTAELFIELDVPANVGSRRFGVWLTSVGAARNDSAIWDRFDVSGTYPDLPAIPWPGTPVIRLPPFTFQPGATSGRVRFFGQTAVGASVVARVRRHSLRKVAAN